MIILDNTKIFQEVSYNLEEELEQDIINSARHFFGDKCILINAKRKLNSQSLGGTIPDAFLFNMSDPDNPEFYIVEVELASHSFFNHIFPQITKFFAFFRSALSQRELVDKIFSIISEDAELKRSFKEFIGEREIYKTIQDSIENSQNILFIADGEKSELPEIMDTYADTWGKMVKLMVIRKFRCEEHTLFLVDPEFENLELGVEATDRRVDQSKKIDVTEEFHFEGVNEDIIDTYLKIKTLLFAELPDLTFNPQKHYISIRAKKNIAILRFSKKSLTCIVMLPEEEIRNGILNHPVQSLSKSVQTFYNNPCASIRIGGDDHLEEVIEIIKRAVERN